jgi:hypothetical protein
VADALGRLGDQRATGPLASALQDPNRFVRENAARALTALGWEKGNKERDEALSLATGHYYGLKRDVSSVSYLGPRSPLDVGGDGIAEFVRGIIQKTRSAHLIVAPRLGLVIAVRPDGQYSAWEFRSPMTTSAAADLMASLATGGKTVRMLEEFDAIELR